MGAIPLEPLAIAVVLFVSTNVDDLVLLAAFFADPALSIRQIVLGQFLGIGALVAISTAAALAALSIPAGWTALLGAVPLFLGLWKLWTLRTATPHANPAADLRAREHALAAGTRSQMLAVAAVTIANGGDNLAVYIPVFAADRAAIPLYGLVFAGLTAAWCAAGYGLVNHPVAGAHLRRYGRILLPVVLIVLGAWILSGSTAIAR